jgi:hypothetical protein
MHPVTAAANLTTAFPPALALGAGAGMPADPSTLATLSSPGGAGPALPMVASPPPVAKKKPKASSKNKLPPNGCFACQDTAQYAAEVRAKLKITKQQVRRLYEVRKLATINFDNEKQYTSYRKEVKARLLAANAEQLYILASDDNERKRQLTMLYKKDEAKFYSLLKKCGQKTFQNKLPPSCVPKTSPTTGKPSRDSK